MTDDEDDEAGLDEPVPDDVMAEIAKILGFDPFQNQPPEGETDDE